MKSHPDQECRGINNEKTLFNSLDQDIIIFNNHICRRFELIVFKKRIN